MIEEIPIDESEQITESEQIAEAEQIAEPEVKPKPRAKGRPKGALGKKKKVDDVPQKKKPKPPPSESEEEEEPQPRKKQKVQREPSPDSRSSYEPPDSRLIAAEVLQLLSNRHIDRSAAKREKYRSWFNPV